MPACQHFILKAITEMCVYLVLPWAGAWNSKYKFELTCSFLQSCSLSLEKDCREASYFSIQIKNYWGNNLGLVSTKRANLCTNQLSFVQNGFNSRKEIITEFDGKIIYRFCHFPIPTHMSSSCPRVSSERCSSSFLFTCHRCGGFLILVDGFERSLSCSSHW